MEVVKLNYILQNTEKNISLCLIILQDGADIVSSRSNNENWIPFEFKINIDDNEYVIGKNCKAMMTVFECLDLINGLSSLTKPNLENSYYLYNSSEAFFSLKLEFFSVDNCFEFEIWINMGAITSGKIYGYDKGIRFIATKREVQEFIRDLEIQSKHIKGLWC